MSYFTANLTPVEEEIRDERARQDAKWGEQNHPDLDPTDIDIVARNVYAFRAKRWQEINAERAEPTVTTRCRVCPEGDTPHKHTAWDGVLLEEVYEALAEPDPDKRRDELIQVAAVAVAYIEALDRRTSTGAPIRLLNAAGSHTCQGLKIWELGDEGGHVIALGHVHKEWLASAILTLHEDVHDAPLDQVMLTDIRHTTARVEDDPGGRFDFVTRTGDGLDFNVTEWRQGSAKDSPEAVR
jgi:hypothetical protein